MDRASVVQSTKATSIIPPAQGILHRKCACGNHMIASDECDECAKNKSSLQRKIAIGTSHDPMETEADRVADLVMGLSYHTPNGALRPIQRLSRQSIAHQDAAPASVDRVLNSSGSPLASSIRLDMEQRFGHDFSRVRVLSGMGAEQSARDVNANAYTVGHKIVFAPGRYNPQTHEGQRLIAHELTHVVQQSQNSAQVPQNMQNIVQRAPNNNQSDQPDSKSKPGKQAPWRGNVSDSLRFLVEMFTNDQDVVEKILDELIPTVRWEVNGEVMNSAEFEKFMNEGGETGYSVDPSLLARISEISGKKYPVEAIEQLFVLRNLTDEIMAIAPTVEEKQKSDKDRDEDSTSRNEFVIPEPPAPAPHAEENENKNNSIPRGQPTKSLFTLTNQDSSKDRAFVTFKGVDSESKYDPAGRIQFNGQTRRELHAAINAKAKLAFKFHFKDRLLISDNERTTRPASIIEVDQLFEELPISTKISSIRQLKPGDEIVVEFDVGKTEALLQESGMLQAREETRALLAVEGTTVEDRILLEAAGEAPINSIAMLGTKAIKLAKKRLRKAGRDLKGKFTGKGPKPGRAFERKALAKVKTTHKHVAEQIKICPNNKHKAPCTFVDILAAENTKMLRRGEVDLFETKAFSPEARIRQYHAHREIEKYGGTVRSNKSTVFPNKMEIRCKEVRLLTPNNIDD